jgi:cell division protein FtsQ
MKAKPNPNPNPNPPRRVLLPALAAAMVIAAIAVVAWWGYATVVSHPVQRVIFAGEVDRLPQADLEALAHAVQAAPGASLQAVRASALKVPWVRDAAVRRHFPDAMEITFEAHEAIARWDDERLVSASGEVFRADRADHGLPRFRGPEGSAIAMVRQYAAIEREVAPLGSAIDELRLSPRGAWHVVLRSGLSLQLGRGDVTPRLARFVAAWPRLVEQQPEPHYVDLRYPGGFATRRAATVTVPHKNDRK